ncbi:hypothetical protein E5082_13750 [Streptomyces griseoluteus]|uniref:Lipoprotein n=1 Tax=Streptomyces griseoluteus TaxID=29306 RepID=A0A4Z1DJP8_STRGP|nr:hypothetical protein E5082_13750 [Streptomyces griseoluteus]GHF06102.1 hypothetical protein GCM10017776_24880 [Streptomyces griseoluteus]
MALLLGCAATGCGESHAAADPRSAGQLLDSADRAMKALGSVTITTETAATGGGTVYSGHETTDLKGRCVYKARFRSGAELEQIRTGGTDYIHGNAMYFEMWGRGTVPAMREKPWLKSPVGAARDADGLKDCTWPFTSFGRPAKGARAELDGRPVIPVEVRDKGGESPFAREPGTYTFYVAAEGTPYLLKFDYKGPHIRTTTVFTGFDKPLAVRPPAPADTLDLGTVRNSG